LRLSRIITLYHFFESKIMKDGWIKIHRSLLECNELIGNYERIGLWMVLLLLASHRPHTVKKYKRDLEAGQLLTNLNKLSKLSGISETKIYRLLHYFSDNDMITIDGTNKYTVITIINYRKYQDIKVTQYDNEESEKQNISSSDCNTKDYEHTINESEKQNIRETQNEKQNSAVKHCNTTSCDDSEKQSETQNEKQNDVYNLIIDKNVLNKKENKKKNPPAPLQAGGRRDHHFFSFLENSFNQFAEMYDKDFESEHEKTRCWGIWQQLDEPTIAAILFHVPEYCSSASSVRFLKNPLNYLLNKTWLQPIDYNKDNLSDKSNRKTKKMCQETRKEFWQDALENAEETEAEIIEEPISKNKKKDFEHSISNLPERLKLPDNYGCGTSLKRL